ncbi:hypothetical protein CY34DRAFT_798509 [Suillus luteus UH-Slu-Lm8-n1]|uniref:Uncharacterized protein n=1 Tax=Suillus luteus UH-Slu-Lm8-n1 TaxID=930992 RepID=A0A0D0BZC5_9AGAM|nr:hypothetical protein CY34DRAFT_798509 [Suillus luteus UH-Slu-Lm8-n1]
MNHDTIWLTGVRSQSKGTATVTALRLRSRRALLSSGYHRNHRRPRILSTKRSDDLSRRPG